MVSIALAGSQDEALRAALADLVMEVGAMLAAEGSTAPPDLILVLVLSPDELVARLDAARAHAPTATRVVLAPFQQPHLTARALALGAAACHCLDQPTEHLTATLRALLGLPEQLPARSAGT